MDPKAKRGPEPTPTHTFVNERTAVDSVCKSRLAKLHPHGLAETSMEVVCLH